MMYLMLFGLYLSGVLFVCFVLRWFNEKDSVYNLSTVLCLASWCASVFVMGGLFVGWLSKINYLKVIDDWVQSRD